MPRRKNFDSEFKKRQRQDSRRCMHILLCVMFTGTITMGYFMLSLMYPHGSHGVPTDTTHTHLSGTSHTATSREQLLKSLIQAQLQQQQTGQQQQQPQQQFQPSTDPISSLPPSPPPTATEDTFQPLRPEERQQMFPKTNDNILHLVPQDHHQIDPFTNTQPPPSEQAMQKTPRSVDIVNKVCAEILLSLDEVDLPTDQKNNVRARKEQLFTFLRRAPQHAPPGFFDPVQKRGIVMTHNPVGAFEAVVVLRLLRYVHNSKLPVAFYYHGEEEKPTPAVMAEFRKLNVDSYDLTLFQISVPRNRPDKHFGAKVSAIFLAPFEEVLFLDCDNFPLRDPSDLFDHPIFIQYGAALWPDLWTAGNPWDNSFGVNLTSPLWEVTDTKPVTEPLGFNIRSIETGQILVNKRKSWLPLLSWLFMEHEADFYSDLGFGDKESLRFSFFATRQAYHQMPLPGVVGPTLFVKQDDRNLCDRHLSDNGCAQTIGISLAHHDFEGKILFFHAVLWKRKRMLTHGDDHTWFSGSWRSSKHKWDRVEWWRWEEDDPIKWNTLDTPNKASIKPVLQLHLLGRTHRTRVAELLNYEIEKHVHNHTKYVIDLFNKEKRGEMRKRLEKFS